MKKSPFESITHFCLIQMEILKDREFKLRKEIEDCKIQKEFLSQLLQDLGKSNEIETDIVYNLLNTMRSTKK